MEETKPAPLSAETVAVHVPQVPASSKVAAVVLPFAAPGVVPVRAATAPTAKK